MKIWTCGCRVVLEILPKDRLQSNSKIKRIILKWRKLGKLTSLRCDMEKKFTFKYLKLK